MTIYGYARVSTQRQNLERQIKNIQDYSAEAIVLTEKYSGKTQSRPVWETLKDKVSEGDTIIFDEISRMSRNSAEGFKEYRELYDRGVNLIFLQERHLDTECFKQALKQGVPMTSTDVDCILKGINEYLMILAEKQIKIAFEHAEYELIAKARNTSNGLQVAKLKGKRVGAQKNDTWETKKSKESKKVILKHSKAFGGSLTDAEIIKMLGIRRNTYYKYKKELKERG